jgi:hypothetical protein
MVRADDSRGARSGIRSNPLGNIADIFAIARYFNELGRTDVRSKNGSASACKVFTDIVARAGAQTRRREVVVS